VTGSAGSYAVSTSSTATELVTGSKGEIAVSGLAAGKYIFVETAAADSSYVFDSSNPITGIITVTAGLTTEATTVGSSTNRADVTNTKAPGAAFLNKTITGENTAIAGAKFALYSYENSAKTGNAISVTGSNGDYALASSSSVTGAATELVTGSKGQITVSGLTAGQYVFVETAAANSTYAFDSSNPVEGIVTVTAGNIVESSSAGINTNRADVSNKKAPGSAYLNKTVFGTGVAIQGVKFSLYQYDGSSKTGAAIAATGSDGVYMASSSGSVTEFVTNSQGKIIVNGLKEGQYIFVETAAANSTYAFDSNNPATGVVTVTAGTTVEAATAGSSANRVDVTNNELTSVKVTKAWIDNNNADDLRPASVNVQLFAGDQVQGNTVTLSTSNNWNYTWTNLQKYDSKGNTIAYTVKELTQNTNSIVDDQHNFNSAYLTSYAKGEDGNFIISNIHSASAEFTIAATKALSGKTLQKDEFSFTLYANNTVAGQTVTTQAATYKNNADGTLYQTSGDGKGIVLTQAGTYSYTLVENSLSETGLTYDTSAYTFTLTASSQNSTGAADGKLHLALSGSSTSITMDSNTNIITLANRNSSKATFNNTYSAVGTLKLAATKAVIDKDKSKIATQNTFNFGLFKGTAETGTVIATGTSASAGINDIYGITFTGTGSYATGNNGEIRLSAGTNQLYTIAELDGNGKTVTRNEQSGGYTYDSTQYQFTADVKDNGDGYLQFTNINGATAGSSSITLSPTYTKGITTLNLSASSQNNNAGVTASFINQYNASGSLKMLASKILVNDSGNSVMALTDSSGKLKYDFTFDILEGSTVVSTGKIANFDGSALGADLTKGTIAFEPISYTSEGEHIYTVEETSKDGNGITRDRSVYNLYVVVTDQKNGSLQVAEYTDAAHKNSVALTANGTVYTGTVAEASKVTAGLSGLKENASFINLYKAEDASLKITATKYLEGASLPTGSNAFQFNLLKVSETGWENWTKSDISAILSSIFNNGQTKTYTVDSSSPSKGLITFDNLSYTDKMIGQTFNYVVYESSGDSQYTASDAVYKFSVTVVDNGNGTLGLAVKDTGNNILNVSNDTLALAQLAADKTNDFINTYDSKDLSVTKSFLGDITDTLAGTVTVQLYTYDPSHLDQTPAAYKDATGNSYIHVFTAGTKNSDGRYHWTQDELSYKFAGLPKYDSAHEEIHYCVKEINPESGYEVRYYNADGTTINTNAYSIFGSTNTAKIDNCEETALTGTKTWNDNSNLYGVRPSAIKVTLLQNGQVYQVKDQNGNLTDDSQIISANNAVSGNSNAWTYSFGSIPLYDLNGQTYKYTVEETYADTSATSTSQFLNYYVAGTSQTGLTSSVGYISDSMDLVNTLKTVSISGSKVWNDSNNASGARPSSITVNLYRNGSPYTLNSIQVSKTVTADANGNWSFSFTDLPMYELTYTTGGAIALTPNIYSVGETAVSNYTTAITGSMANGYIITNTHQTSGGRAYLVKVASNDTNLVLEGATFGLYKSDGTLINYYTSNSSGVVSASNLAAGSYYFQETGAPSGYGVNGSQFSFTISTSDYESGNSIYVGKVTDTVTTTTTTTTTTTSQSSVLGARRDLQTPEDNKGEVLGATRAPKTSDSSKALLWMLVMGASGLGAAAVMAQRRKELKQRNEKSATDQTRKL